MKIIAIIPARGGSKGIPRKNVRLIAGKPLLAYSVEAARATKAIERVIVSTDDAEIRRVAQDCGAEVVWRPDEISGDLATSESALLHTLDYLLKKERYEPDLVVFLQATSPLRQFDDIAKAIETLNAKQADSLFSACTFHNFIWRIEGETTTSYNYDYRQRRRRQDGLDEVMENGSVYIFKPWVLRQFNNRLGGRIAVYRMAMLDSFQIDDPDDMKLIESLAKLHRD